MLEEDYLTSRGGSRTAPTYQQYAFSDPRMKELNQYSTQLIRELILPKLTQEVNTSKKYAQLRQVFFSLILSRWFKDRYSKVTASPDNSYANRIDSGNLTNLTSKEAWSKDYYFNEYKKSFQEGEYNLKEQIITPTGQLIRSYVSGGIRPTLESKDINSFKVSGSPLTNNVMFTRILVSVSLGIGFFGYGLVETVKYFDRLVKAEESVMAIKSDLERFLDNLRGEAETTNDPKAWERYLRLKHEVLPNLKTKTVEEVINGLKQAIETAPAGQKDILENFLKLFQEKGSSPLTQVEARKQVQEQFNLLNRDPRFKNQPEWENIDKEYSYYADFKIDEKKYLDILNSKITRLVTDVRAIKDTALKNAAQILVNKFKALSVAAALELGVMNESEVFSSLTQDLPQNTNSPLFPGGIDFRKIEYLTQPMGSFQGLDLRLPLLSKAELEGIDIGREMAAMEQMINAKIDVSTDRLKRLLAAMSQKDAFSAQRETQLLPLLLRLCWLKEERGVETTPDFRAVLLIADTGLFVEQGNTRHSLN